MEQFNLDFGKEAAQVPPPQEKGGIEMRTIRNAQDYLERKHGVKLEYLGERTGENNNLQALIFKKIGDGLLPDTLLCATRDIDKGTMWEMEEIQAEGSN